MIYGIVFLIFAVVILFILVNVGYGLLFMKGKHTPVIKAILGSTYFARTNEFKIYNRFSKPGGIVFIGDSLTQRYPLQDFYPGMHVYNRGIDGETTTGLLKRLSISVFDLKPNIVVLQIGTNDLQLIGMPMEETVKKIHTIIEKILEFKANMKILLVSLYPVNETSEKLVEKIVVGPRKNIDLQAINQKLKTFSSVTFVDVYPHLLDDQGQLDMKNTKEGLHLSLQGYATVTNVIKPVLETLL
jgi:lysophospholipase L1-like esterase